MNWNCKYACMWCHQNGGKSQFGFQEAFFYYLESKLRFDSILVAKQAYAIDNEKGKLNRAESYMAT